jgi:hypothetical protein
MTRAELDALIEEATVDAYNDHEQITGLFTMLDEHLAVPFDTELLGITVTVKNRSLSCRFPRGDRTARSGSTPTGGGGAEDQVGGSRNANRRGSNDGTSPPAVAASRAECSPAATFESSENSRISSS